MNISRKPLLIIAGPTAVGKTDASILLAQELNGEIVSADSMQVYHGMDIGSAKSTLEQRTAVRHHLIDVVEPDQPYSVGDYLRQARQALDEIVRSKKFPLVVGGTGLYIRALTRGLFQGPPADPQLREEFMQEEASKGPGFLHATLRNLDPEAAVKIHEHDLRRIVRALEVYHLKNRKLSEFHEEHALQNKPYEFTLVFLCRARSDLYARIEERIDRMIASGLENEVRTLLGRGFSPDLVSMQGLGYRHFAGYIQGALSRNEAEALLKRDTKRFAKRQFTWFRREPDAIWIDITGISDAREILQHIKKHPAVKKYIEI
ncbi:MAG: tRNA (adenosine(37)-N6)-dimethylallyltransferase MiaA [Nitrospirota bacterium]